MKQETRAKLSMAWIKIKKVTRDWAPAVGIGGGLGMLIGGYFGAIKNHSDIQKLEKRHEHLVGTVNQHADAGNALVDRVNEEKQRIEELQRQNALLMEKALHLTEGKAS